jgi:thiamine-phosphate pyrophosphorylase
LDSLKKIGRLHVLTDTRVQARLTHLDIAKAAIAGGADSIQFRHKGGSTRELIAWATQMMHACAGEGVPFLVNDRLDVAMAVKADGIHLGREDFPLPLARDILGRDTIIGATATSLKEARACFQEGADYIGFGPVFTTTSKKDAGPACGIEGLAEAVETIPVPIIAIGGLTPETIPLVMETGAHGVAVISAVCGRDDPEQAARELRNAVDRFV